jgi:hypothetical protein
VDLKIRIGMRGILVSSISTMHIRFLSLQLLFLCLIMCCHHRCETLCQLGGELEFLSADGRAREMPMPRRLILRVLKILHVMTFYRHCYLVSICFSTHLPEKITDLYPCRPLSGMDSLSAS